MRTVPVVRLLCLMKTALYFFRAAHKIWVSKVGNPRNLALEKNPFGKLDWWIHTKPHETQGMKQKQATEGEICKELESKYRLYGELEAIYSLGKISGVNNKQTGSGSALTNENSPKNVDLVPVPFGGSHGLNGGPAATAGVDDGSEASIEEEVSYRKVQKRKRKRKRRMKEQLSSSTTRFFEGLVKRVMDHQESLHHKYLALIEKMDRERREREAAWRLQEAEKHKRKAIAQLHEQALASKRESLIVSYIEKITGQRVNIPSRETPSLLQCDYSNGAMEEELTPVKVDQTNSRWPQSEVEALIRVRSNIESKFQEPGLKGPLWEQVSASMASLGYQRSAKRCKEKWENINKYFRKTKNSPKKRPQQSKTCSYFNKLDQLYSRTPITNPSSSSYCSSNPVVGIERQGYSELLQAVLDGSETQNLSSGNFEILSEIGSNRLDFDGITNGKVEHLREEHGKEKENHEDDGSMEEEDIDGNDSDE
ncbi:trihelix transcription factor GT-2-like isoform X2 [Rosa rugosa]|uniref:trihelix transcription factor GT-2-like isoform X2 n=1 Tax=Rosa rugosa TaxID=74645 RepID=UPI002B412990|nr:trihelix transcription factor GT-2-like isoform X2 [Rosa rugosa]